MSAPDAPARSAPLALWILPLVAGLLPAVASLAAFAISVAQEAIAPCNPFVDGCVSVSRAARHGLANHVFRALVLPAALLQGLTWFLCAAWHRRLGDAGASNRWLPWLGGVAAVFLVLYGTFLGTEGEAYRWMRRYGIVGYFGGTMLCMLVAGGIVRRLAAEGAMRVPARLDRLLLALVALTLLMGLANVFLPPIVGDEAFKNRLENVMEWNAGVAFSLFFAALAWLWRRTGFVASLHATGLQGDTIRRR